MAGHVPSPSKLNSLLTDVGVAAAVKITNLRALAVIPGLGFVKDPAMFHPTMNKKLRIMSPTNSQVLDTHIRPS